MIFVDSWAWIALAIPRDQHHSRAKAAHAAFRKARRRYVTTDYVLSEVISYLYRWQPHGDARTFIDGLLTRAEQGEHILLMIDSSQFQAAWTLRQRYHDKPDISFVDLTSMVVMRDLGLTEIFTGDDHFRQVGLGFQVRP